MLKRNQKLRRVNVNFSDEVIMVLIQGNDYKRFVGNKLTNHIEVDKPLTKQQVEDFRLDPINFIDNYEEK